MKNYHQNNRYGLILLHYQNHINKNHILMKKRLLTFFSLAIYLSSFAQTLPLKQDVFAKMKLVNDYWISTNTSPGNNQWARAVYFAGNLDFYKYYPKDSYLQYATSWANNYNWGLNGGTYTRNADNQTCGQAYIDMYKLDSIKQPSKIAAIKNSIDNMVYSSSSADWTWIDAIFMSMPVFARLGVLTGDSIYFNRMYDLYAYNKYTLGLYNSSEGLWYRDVNYKPPYATKNGQDCYWSRGNGWVVGAHVRILQLLPLKDSHRAEYIQTFQAMAAALKDRQREDGFWNPSLDDANEYIGPETSGTAFFTYGLAWGINNHLLDSATYSPVVAKAWNGLVNTAIQANGFLGYVQGVGAAPALAVSTSTQDFGVGAFLMAGTEVQKLCTGTIPAPVNFSLKSVKAIDQTHILVSFNRKVDVTSGIIATNYSVNNSITVNAATTTPNDSAINLTVSTMPYGAYQLSVSGIRSTKNETIESGDNKSFVLSNVVSVTASGYESGTTNTADKTLDYDFNTRWSCDGKGQWILYDLGALKMVNSVDLAFFNGNIRKGIFAINLMKTLTDSVQVFNGRSSGTTAALENYDFTDQQARYVKIIGQGNTSSTWNSITETRINWTDIPSAVDNISADDFFFVSPNPYSHGILKISAGSKARKVIIADLSGKTIQILTPESNSLSNLNLQAGAYIISVRFDQNTSSKLLIVK
jgi:rhamnogalacturonyl hydrolase YesR